MIIILTAIGIYLIIGVAITICILLYDKYSFACKYYGKCLNEKYYNSKFTKKCGYVALMIISLPAAVIISIPIIVKERVLLKRIS